MVSNHWSCISLHSLKKHSGGESRRQKTLNPVKQMRFSLGVLAHPILPCRITPRDPSSQQMKQHEFVNEQKTAKSSFLLYLFFLPPAGSHHLPSELASLQRSQNPPCWCSSVQIIPTLGLPGAWAHSGKQVRNISACCFHRCWTSVFLHYKKHIHCLDFNSGFRLFDLFLWPFNSKKES